MRYCIGMIFVVLLSGSLGRADEKAQNVEIGISKTKPAQGPFVEIEGGYMVPYKMTIPGTETTFEMVPIPGGKAIIGSPADEKGRNADEGPQFEVIVEPFWMGKYEVTWAEYTELMKLYLVFKEFDYYGMRKVTDENKLDAVTAPTKLHEPDHTYKHGQRPEQAAVTMTQFAARQYTKWLSLTCDQFYRLPTEAEWEYAARGGTKTAYSFDDEAGDIREYGWTKEEVGEEKGQRDVGQKKPNAFGLFDMHGNVWEWTLDQYDLAGYKKQEGKTLTVWEAVNWPTKQSSRVLRGGSWEFGAERARSAARLESDEAGWKEYDPNLPLSPWWYTSDPARGVGFRLVRQLKPGDAELKKKVWEIDDEITELDVGDRLSEGNGRGALGLIDKQLQAAIIELEAKKKAELEAKKKKGN